MLPTLLALLAFACVTSVLPAQVPAKPPADTGIRAISKPPISPKHAFIASAIVPGIAQSALHRGTGAIFMFAESVGLVMYAKSRHDLQIARAFHNDSTPLTYVIEPATGLPQIDEKTGLPAVATWSFNHYNTDRVRARKTHLEDWKALLIFNHMFAAIDALVAAHLWELPAQVQFRPFGAGAMISARVHW
ncbi:MAG TPA: hypothetical protein VE967_01795 [Gemmatimonadaceae bacterium]|nr:hypothetical protein [Gemmatimonadaceae bacterium]